MKRPRRWIVVALVANVAVSCGGAQRGQGPPRCAPPIGISAGFEVTQSLEDRHPDRVATRTGLRDARGRTLNLFSGVEAEFGEGLPLVGEVELIGGTTARLLGDDRVWLLAWREGDGPCSSKAVFASGFREAAFLRVMREGGLVT